MLYKTVSGQGIRKKNSSPPFVRSFFFSSRLHKLTAPRTFVSPCSISLYVPSFISSRLLKSLPFKSLACKPFAPNSRRLVTNLGLLFGSPGSLAWWTTLLYALPFPASNTPGIRLPQHRRVLRRSPFWSRRTRSTLRFSCRCWIDQLHYIVCWWNVPLVKLPLSCSFTTVTVLSECKRCGRLKVKSGRDATRRVWSDRCDNKTYGNEASQLRIS